MRRLLPLVLIALVGCAGPSEKAPALAHSDAAAFLGQIEAAAPTDRIGLLKAHPDERDALRADPAMRARLDRALGVRN